MLKEIAAAPAVHRGVTPRREGYRVADGRRGGGGRTGRAERGAEIGESKERVRLHSRQYTLNTFQMEPPEVTARPLLLTRDMTHPFASNNRSTGAIHPYARRSPLLGSPECLRTTTQLTIIKNKQCQQERCNYCKSFRGAPWRLPSLCNISRACARLLPTAARAVYRRGWVGGWVRGVQEIRLNHPPGLLLYDKTVPGTW